MRLNQWRVTHIVTQVIIITLLLFLGYTACLQEAGTVTSPLGDDVDNAVVVEVRYIRDLSCDVGVTLLAEIDGHEATIKVEVHENEIKGTHVSYLPIHYTRINLDGRVYYRLRSPSGRVLGAIEVEASQQ